MRVAVFDTIRQARDAGYVLDYVAPTLEPGMAFVSCEARVCPVFIRRDDGDPTVVYGCGTSHVPSYDTEHCHVELCHGRLGDDKLTTRRRT